MRTTTLAAGLAFILAAAACSPEPADPPREAPATTPFRDALMDRGLPAGRFTLSGNDLLDTATGQLWTRTNGTWCESGPRRILPLPGSR